MLLAMHSLLIKNQGHLQMEIVSILNRAAHATILPKPRPISDEVFPTVWVSFAFEIFRCTMKTIIESEILVIGSRKCGHFEHLCADSLCYLVWFALDK